MVHEHHLTVPRTARYYVLGDPGPSVRELWIACHGYGQLAAGFAAAFAAVAGPERLLVFPEGLSRFYHEHPHGGSHHDSAVGASWMTREDRAAEIADQVTYLDRLADEVGGAMVEPPALTALGFSQGVATICRWLAHSRHRAQRLICWGGLIPDDVRPSHRDAFREARIIFVNGERDGMTPPERSRLECADLAKHGIRATVLTFPGGHRLDGETLQAIALGHE